MTKTSAWVVGWPTVSACAASLSSVMVVVALTVAARQLKEARRARKGNLLLGLHDRYHSTELQALRRRLLLGELGDLNFLSEEDANGLARLLNELQMVGVYVKMRLLTKADVTSLFGGSPRRVWTATEAFVRTQRSAGRPEYLQTFQKAFGLDGSQSSEVSAEYHEPESDPDRE